MSKVALSADEDTNALHAISQMVRTQINWELPQKFYDICQCLF